MNLAMLKQYKTKEFEHCFCQYLKNNMADIRLIPLDHVTYVTRSREMSRMSKIFTTVSGKLDMLHFDAICKPH